jgi:hypothetical protein
VVAAVSDAAVPEEALGPVSSLAVTAFGSADEALDAVLKLAQDILHMGTVFIAEADRGAGTLNILAVREGENGCDLPPGTEVPLEETV